MLRKGLIALSFAAFLLGVLGCGKAAKTGDDGIGKEKKAHIQESIDYVGDGVYPIIFIHGHSSSLSVETTWSDMMAKLESVEGYHSYPQAVYEETKLPAHLSPQTMFRFCYYRANERADFGHIPGFIGACPKKFISPPEFTWPTGQPSPGTILNDVFNVNSKYYYWGQPRVSYAKRLETAVDEVRRATGSNKVILVGHSMGGLVARSYIRWLSGHSKVYKVLTIGTPNKGVPNDARTLIDKIINAKEWQWYGQCEEFSKQRNFSGKSYTEWLNDGWEEFCKKSGVQYATIRGNYNPWTITKIGDGVVEESDATIDGAVFNSVVFAAHLEKIGDLPIIGDLIGNSNGDFFNHTATAEYDLTRTSFVTEVIKRWCIQNLVHTNASIDEVVAYPTLFNQELALGFHPKNNPIYAQVEIVDGQQHTRALFGFALSNQPYQKLFLSNLGFLDNDFHFAVIRVYDMGGQISSQKVKVVKTSTRNTANELLETLSFIKTPQKFSPSPISTFQVALTSYTGTNKRYFYFKLDDQDWSIGSSADTSTYNNLSDGEHILYCKGARELDTNYSDGTRRQQLSNVLEYHWIQGFSSQITIDNEIISSQENFKASSSVSLQNTVLTNTSKVSITSKAINIKNNFDIKQGAYADIKCQ